MKTRICKKTCSVFMILIPIIIMGSGIFFWAIFFNKVDVRNKLTEKGQLAAVHLKHLSMSNVLQKAAEEFNPKDRSFYIQCIQNLNQGNNITYADGYYYFRSQTENYSLCRRKEAGEETEIITDMIPNEIYVRDKVVYFINASDSQSFYRVGIDGSNLTKISDLPMKNMIIIGDIVYFLSVYERENDPFYQLVEEEIAVNDSCLYSMKLDGTEQRLLVARQCLEFTTDGRNLYYRVYDRNAGENGEFIIYECSMDGTGERVRHQGENGIYGLVPYKGRLYGYTVEHDEYEMLQIDRNGDLHILVTDTEKHLVAISENNLYLYGNNEISRYDLRMKEKQIEASKSTDDASWDVTYYDRGIFLVNGKLFVKYRESDNKGILWHIWNEDKEEFNIFEDMEILDPEELVKDTSHDYELNFYYPGEEDPFAETFLDGELTHKDVFLTREDGVEFGTFEFSLPLFNSGVQGYQTINHTMRELMDAAMETKESYFQDLEKNENEFSFGHLRYDYSHLYVGEKYISMCFYLDGYTGGLRDWEEVFPLTFDRTTGELLTMDDLFNVDRNHYMKRLTGAVYKFCEMEGDSWWNDAFDNNVLVKNFASNCFYLTPDGIVLCYARYSVQVGAYGNPTFEIPYSWFGDIFKDS